MARVADYPTGATLAMAISAGIRDFLNMYRAEKAEKKRQEKEDALFKMQVGRNVLDVHNQVAENDYRERETARRTKEDADNAAYRAEMLQLQRDKLAADAADVGYPSPEGVLGNQLLTGKIDQPTYDRRLREVNTSTGTGSKAGKEPPDFVSLFYNLVNAAEDRYDKKKQAWIKANDPYGVKRPQDIPPYEGPEPDARTLFDRVIAPRAGRLLGPAAVDSIRTEAGGIFPEILEQPPTAIVGANYAPPEETGIAMPTKGPAAAGTNKRQMAIDSLIKDFGQEEWNSATAEVREAAIAKRLRELGG